MREFDLAGGVGILTFVIFAFSAAAGWMLGFYVSDNRCDTTKKNDRMKRPKTSDQATITNNAG